MNTAFQIPAHVPQELVRDFDMFNLPGGSEDVHLAWKRVQDANPDIFYTPHYGGYWVLSRAEWIATVFPDYERFASSGSIGIPLPPAGTPPQLPIESDPPVHRYYRAPINLAVSPLSVKRYSEDARALAIELIEGFKPRGECEFMSDFARHLPMTIFLRMVDLPLSDRVWLISQAEIMVRDNDNEKRMAALHAIFGYLDGWIRKRREQPGNDLISHIVNLKVGDRPMTHEEALGECSQVLFGGLDTVAGTMGFVARFLAEHPAHRRQLVADPSLIPHAIEELLRRHSIPTIARRLTRDVELDGIQMKAGEQVMIPICLHGLDERAWDKPLDVDFNRDVHDHVAFGKGIHKCPGSTLARAELRIFLEEWLQRIPDFRIKPGDHAVTLPGQVMGMGYLPLVWDKP